MASKKEVLLLIFTPFLVNLTMTVLNAFFIPAEAWKSDYEHALLTFLTRLYSLQSLGMICVQVTLGMMALKRLRNPRKLYDVSELRSFRTLCLIAGLVLLAFALFFAEGALTVYLYYGGDWGVYREMWEICRSSTPAWAKYMNALLAPFTAGIFEEVIWRGWGITELEKFTSTRQAVLLQAVAFGLWHVNPMHAAVTFLIGLAYGAAFAKRRKLTALTAAHVMTDLLGFSTWIA